LFEIQSTEAGATGKIHGTTPPVSFSRGKRAKERRKKKVSRKATGERNERLKLEGKKGWEKGKGRGSGEIRRWERGKRGSE